MVMPKDQIHGEIMESWRIYVVSLEKALEKLENDISEASEMTEVCTGEWCRATEHVIDDIANSLFSISEPRDSAPEDSKKIKELKKRVYDLYANYKDVYKKVS